MPDGDVLRATLEGTFCGEPVNIGLGFVSAAGMADFPADAANLFTSLASTLQLLSSPSPFMAPLSVGYNLTQVRVSDLNPGLAASLTFPVGAVGGNVTDDAMPPNDALCVTWRTGLKGKQNRGRNYLTGFAEDSGTAGYWIPEIQEWALAGFAQPLIDAYAPISAGPYVLSLVHTMSAGVPIIPPTATPIINYTIHNEVRTLRRRAIGVRISRRPSTP